MKILQKMKQDWDRRAKQHSRYWISTNAWETPEKFDRSGEDAAQMVLDCLEGGDHSTKRVLDLGCGIGRIARPLSTHFESIVGVDISPTMISQSKNYLRECSNVTTLETNGMDLTPLPTAEFDYAYSIWVVQHLPKVIFAKYLQELNRVIKPRGLLIVQICLGRQELSPSDTGETLAIQVYNPHEFVALFRHAGFIFVREFLNAIEPGCESWWVVLERVEDTAGFDIEEHLLVEYSDKQSLVDKAVEKTLLLQYTPTQP